MLAVDAADAGAAAARAQELFAADPQFELVSLGEVTLLLSVTPDGLGIRSLAPRRLVDLPPGPADAADLVIAARPSLFRLFAGQLSPTDAVSDGSAWACRMRR